MAGHLHDSTPVTPCGSSRRVASCSPAPPWASTGSSNSSSDSTCGVKCDVVSS